MIPKYENAKGEKITGYSKKNLPAGGYVGTITGARLETNDYGTKLLIAFDVTEGQYKGFFKADFDANPYDGKKWRGVLRMNVPAGGDKVYDIRSFNNFIACLEESNTGYRFDWDETKLKGKALGFVIRNKEYEFNGYRGWTTEAGGVASVEDIRNNTFKALKDKPLRESATPVVVDDGLDDEPMPF